MLLHIEELDQQLELKAKSGAVVNVTDYLLWFTFDLMGDFTFSTPFGVLWIKDWYESVDWCQEQIQARLAKGPAPELRDLTYYTMEKEKENKVDAGPWLRGDSLLAVLAGRSVFPLPLCAQ